MHVEIPDSKTASSILKRNLLMIVLCYVSIFAQLISNVVLWFQTKPPVCWISVCYKISLFVVKYISHSARMLEAEAIWPPDETETNFMHS